MRIEPIDDVADQTRNAIINGNFDIWQRATTILGITTDQYTGDRWLMEHNTGIRCSLN